MELGVVASAARPRVVGDGLVELGLRTEDDLDAEPEAVLEALFDGRLELGGNPAAPNTTLPLWI